MVFWIVIFWIRAAGRRYSLRVVLTISEQRSRNHTQFTTKLNLLFLQTVQQLWRGKHATLRSSGAKTDKKLLTCCVSSFERLRLKLET
jgi:hypothetical protein